MSKLEKNLNAEIEKLVEVKVRVPERVAKFIGYASRRLSIPEEELTATDPIQAALGWFYQQLSNIANRLFSATFPLIRYVAWIPFYLIAIGVPSEFAWGIFSVVMIIQVIGFFEFVTGRPIEK